jgi:hypothetical protein
MLPPFVDHADDRLAAFVDVDVLDADVFHGSSATCGSEFSIECSKREAIASRACHRHELAADLRKPHAMPRMR